MGLGAGGAAAGPGHRGGLLVHRCRVLDRRRRLLFGHRRRRARRRHGAGNHHGSALRRHAELLPDPAPLFAGGGRSAELGGAGRDDDRRRDRRIHGRPRRAAGRPGRQRPNRSHAAELLRPHRADPPRPAAPTAGEARGELRPDLGGIAGTRRRRLAGGGRDRGAALHPTGSVRCGHRGQPRCAPGA